MAANDKINRAMARHVEAILALSPQAHIQVRRCELSGAYTIEGRIGPYNVEGLTEGQVYVGLVDQAADGTVYSDSNQGERGELTTNNQ